MAECSVCAEPVGLEHGLAPFHTEAGVTCARHSGRKASKCRGCKVLFVDIGTRACPYCGSHMIRESS